TMSAISRVDSLGELFQRSQQTQRRTDHFENSRILAIVGRENRGVARHTFEDRHLAEESTGLHHTDLVGLSRSVRGLNFDLRVEREIESISAPIALAHDDFTR